MSANLRTTILLTVTAIMLVAIGGLFYYQVANRGTERSVMASAPIGAPFELIDHNGDPITEKAMAGKPVAVFFGFTHCPEICPTTLYEMAGWLEALGQEGADIDGYFITVDPTRDTPEIMESYVTSFTDRIIGITGDPDRVAELAKAWHIYWRKVPLDDGDYTMDHTASVFLVDRQGHLKSVIAFGEESETAIEKLRNLAAS
ncbi:SCO family protein [Oricola sp.]|uniref:SCO family protein n=1 Tax=Oricola sp. TaxID=1979950 RepID=UPI003BAC97CB